MKNSSLVRSLVGGFLGLALVIGLFLLTGVSFKSLGKLFMHLNYLAFAGIILCSFLYVILGAIKWHLIAGASAPRPFFYTHYTAQAMLIGQFLPPPVAIAVNRAAVMKLKQNVGLKKGFLNAFYDMGFDFLIAALLVPVSLLQLVYHYDFHIWLALGVLIILVADIVLINAPALMPAAWMKKLNLIEERKRGLLSQRIISLMMMLSAARFAVVVIRLALGAIAIDAAVPFATVAYAAPPTTMSALLVLTPANLGIAEWSWAYLLALWGIPVAIGTLYGISFRILVFAAQLIVSGVCWLLYETGKH